MELACKIDLNHGLLSPQTACHRDKPPSDLHDKLWPSPISWKLLNIDPRHFLEDSVEGVGLDPFTAGLVHPTRNSGTSRSF